MDVDRDLFYESSENLGGSFHDVRSEINGEISKLENFRRLRFREQVDSFLFFFQITYERSSRIMRINIAIFFTIDTPALPTENREACCHPLPLRTHAPFDTRAFCSKYTLHVRICGDDPSNILGGEIA